jgi:hypothetical protein
MNIIQKNPIFVEGVRNIYLMNIIQFQGPFDTFLVGGDTAEVSDIKFSNDGKSMLLTTTNNHIYVLDAYGGDKVS